ncbi:alginate export family protein [Pedobacter sp. MC2016-14]|uniref:alginate export family protein n=1 Tax=Pedobacter sp. MC2016-14 TaxID=2897327 RepID=UPI001E5FD37E|nr:alginate export family protein [Pedobacter sp. MC2016-14]MCD0487868.1 alginate export family protein [Pedobacter sp. MC2016-14]
MRIKWLSTKFRLSRMKLRYNLFMLIVVLLSGFFHEDLAAQSIRLMRYDEDYSKLKDADSTFYNRLKYIPISSDREFYLSLGGELRYEYGLKVNEDWIKDQGFNSSFLQRYAVYADLHTGDRLRFFAQLNSALENGSKYGAAPVDEDQLVVQNLFAEFNLLKTGAKSLSIRLGRQEMNYGSGRLISVREGTTTRQYFTGAKLMYSLPKFTLDAFVMEADEVNPGVFDNKGSGQANLWGLYSNIIIERAGNFDVYYLGIKRDHAQFEEGIARELRHTVAARYWKNGGGFIYNLEAAYQFGAFGAGSISAWTGAIDLGYTFEQLKFKPSLNLRNDYISGDRSAGDGKLQTFNPLYPKGGYFGFNPLIGPANLVDLHPYLVLSMTEKLSLQADVVFNWRYSAGDGIYRPSGNFNTAGTASAHRYIGTTYLLSADYRFTPLLSFSCGGQYFKTAAFIRDIVGQTSDSRFFNAQISFKF